MIQFIIFFFIKINPIMFALKIGLINSYIKLHETSVGAYIENMFKWRQIVLQRLDLSLFLYMRNVYVFCFFLIKRNKCSINNI